MAALTHWHWRALQARGGRAARCRRPRRPGEAAGACAPAPASTASDVVCQQRAEPACAAGAGRGRGARERARRGLQRQEPPAGARCAAVRRAATLAWPAGSSHPGAAAPPQAGCGLQMGSQTLRYAACQDLSANVSTGYTLMYTLIDNNNGTCTLSGAVERPAAAPAWVAFGLAKCPGCGMAKGSAVIARTDPASPTGAPALPCPPGGAPCSHAAYPTCAPAIPRRIGTSRRPARSPSTPAGFRQARGAERRRPARRALGAAVAPTPRRRPRRRVRRALLPGRLLAGQDRPGRQPDAAGGERGAVRRAPAGRVPAAAPRLGRGAAGGAAGRAGRGRRADRGGRARAAQGGAGVRPALRGVTVGAADAAAALAACRAAARAACRSPAPLRKCEGEDYPTPTRACPARRRTSGRWTWLAAWRPRQGPRRGPRQGPRQARRPPRSRRRRARRPVRPRPRLPARPAAACFKPPPRRPQTLACPPPPRKRAGYSCRRARHRGWRFKSPLKAPGSP